MNAAKQIESDDIFAEFLNDEYNAEVYSSGIIAAASVSQSLKALKEGITKIDEALESHVTEHYEDLINQATGMDILEESLGLVHGRVEQLQRSMMNIKRRLSEPYRQMQTRTEQLNHLQKTCDVLRRVSRIQYLSKRLKQQLESGNKEITKTAQTFNELDYLYGNGDLKGISAVDKDVEWIQMGRKKVESQAEQLLEQGLSSLNQNQTSTALQVFHNFGKLKPTVKRVLEASCLEMRRELKAVLAGKMEQQFNGLAPGGVSLGGSAGWRAGFWSSLDKWTTQVTGHFDQIHVLHRTLGRRKDPTTHKSLLEECGSTPIEVFVQNLQDTLEESLHNNVNNSTKAALDADYPKILRLLLGLWKHFKSKLNVEGLETVLLPDIDVHGILMGHQCTYLARSLNKLLDPIALAFPGREVPSLSEVENIIRILLGEVSAARGDTQLKQMGIKNGTKAIREIISRCENLVMHGSSVNYITSAPNEYQIKNLQVINILCLVYTKIPDISDSLVFISDEVWSAISETLDTILTPFRSQIEHIFGTIHETDYNFEKTELSDYSTYINLIEETVNHLWKEYISQLTLKETIAPKIKDFQDSLLSLYLYHLSVIRPLSEGGKMKLASDIAEIERIFLQHFERDRMCDSFRNLRSFRAALFLPDRDLVTLKNVPLPILLNHLFSRAGDDLASPYKVAGWTPNQYVAWLHSHPDEVIDMISGAVQWYENMVRESNITSYDEIYPILMQILKQ